MKSILIISLLISSSAYAIGIPEITDGALYSNQVKNYFLSQFNKSKSPLREPLENYLTEGEQIADKQVIVVAKEWMDYTGHNGNPDEFDAEYQVFVGYQKSGRSGMGGTIAFSCKINFKNDEIENAIISCTN